MNTRWRAEIRRTLYALAFITVLMWIACIPSYPGGWLEAFVVVTLISIGAFALIAAGALLIAHWFPWLKY